jgi:ABC-type multidrug transport system fused ATPase/permease subunit
LDPLIIKWLIDGVIPQKNIKLVIAVSGIILLNHAARLIFDAFGGILSFRAVQKTIFKVRLRLLRRIHQLSADYHDRTPVGDTLHRLEQEVARVAEFGGEVVPFVLRTLVVTVASLTAMCILNFRLACIFLPLIPAFIITRQYFQRRLRNYSDSVQSQASAVSSFLQEHLLAVTQIQLLTREITEARKLARLAGLATRTQIKQRMTEIIFTALSAVIVVTGMVSVLGFGSYQVITGSMSVGGLVAFYSYSLELFVPLYSVVGTYSKLQRLGASIRRIREIEQATAAVKESPSARSLPSRRAGKIELQNVCFGYQTGKPVLSNLNLQVHTGENLLIVGESGNGKTTLARLVVRLYDVSAGVILVDGQDIRTVKLMSLRSTICFVPQDPILFNYTLRENILYGNPKATQSQLEKAASIAQLDHLLARLPGGWHEPLGPRGYWLSGGERQRIALARAVLRNPRILLLDEPTSAVDSQTEKGIWECLSDYQRGKTVIVISHRPSAIPWMDRAVTIRAGRVSEGIELKDTYSKARLRHTNNGDVLGTGPMILRE